MKKLLAVAVLMFAPALMAQSLPTAPVPSNVYAVGISGNYAATPPIAGTALYARNLDPKSGLSTYAITVFDAVPTSYSPFTVSTNVGVGVAQDIHKFGNATVWMPTSAGISWTGQNTGFEWNGGVAVTIPFHKNLYLIPNVRFLKSNVSNGSGYQVIEGFLFGWGQ